MPARNAPPRRGGSPTAWSSAVAATALVACLGVSMAPVSEGRAALEVRDYSAGIANAIAKYEPCGGVARPCYSEGLRDSLAPWMPAAGGNPLGISRRLMLEMRAERDAQRLTFYQIVGGRLYRNNSGYAGLSDDWRGCFIEPRCQGIEHFLREVMLRGADGGGRTPLPDVEFFVNVRDVPASHRRGRKVDQFGAPLPILSFSVPDDGRFADIMYPTWAFHKGGPWLKELSTQENRDVWDWSKMQKAMLEAGARHPWESKRDVLFFRGSRTHESRDALVALGQNDDPRLDIQFTKGTSKRADGGRRSAAHPQVHLRDHCSNRYLVNIRGVAASFRLRYALLCGSVVFHVDAEPDYVEFFYSELQPWVHYVPVSADLSDLRGKLQWAREHEREARAIAERGRTFVTQHLRTRDVVDYWDRLLRSYAGLQEPPPPGSKRKVSRGMSLLFDANAELARHANKGEL